MLIPARSTAPLTRQDLAIFFRRTTLGQRLAYRRAHDRDIGAIVVIVWM